MSGVNRPPDLQSELRDIQRRLARLERSLRMTAIQEQLADHEERIDALEDQ